MPVILLIESSTETCSVGLSENGRLLDAREAEGPYEHTARITLLIDELTRGAGRTLKAVDAVAVSIGPGSFTALRVGLSTAKGICYALGKPLIAVDTLAALAGAAVRAYDRDTAVYCPMIDARRMEVYTAFYNASLETLEEAHALIVEGDSFDRFLATGREVVLFGNGAEKCRQVLTTPGVRYLDQVCTAEMLARPANDQFAAGDFADLAYTEPFYLKPPNITTPKSRL